MNLMRFILKEDEPAQVPTTPSQEQKNIPGFSPVGQPTPSAMPSMTSFSSAAPVASVNEKFIAMIEQAINDNNIEGLDYLELKASIMKMSNLPMDEQTKFVSAFIGLETQGCTKQAVLDSIEFYIGIVNGEVKTFNDELATSMKLKVTDKLAECEEAKAKIAALNDEIIKLNSFIMETAQTAQKDEMSLKMAEAEFTQSAQRAINMMASDREKIINYLK